MARIGVGARAARPGLGLPIGASAALHVAAIAALLFHRADAPPPLPPTYKVDLVAAPPGPRAMGQVSEQAPPPTEPATTPPPRAEVDPATMAPAPTKTKATTPPKEKAPPATPTPPGTKKTDAPAQRAGGGPTGGRGTDVANVRTEGIAFPFPGYLSNIVRQIAVRFNPRNPNAPLRADIAFLVHRDGSVTDLRFVTRSGNYAFDLEARGAVEAAAEAGAFGPLPPGFRDDVLPVVFSFDPSLLR